MRLHAFRHGFINLLLGHIRRSIHKPTQMNDGRSLQLDHSMLYGMIQNGVSMGTVTVFESCREPLNNFELGFEFAIRLGLATRFAFLHPAQPLFVGQGPFARL